VSTDFLLSKVQLDIDVAAWRIVFNFFHGVCLYHCQLCSPSQSHKTFKSLNFDRMNVGRFSFAENIKGWLVVPAYISMFQVDYMYINALKA
jgi:hypothetical protein